MYIALSLLIGFALGYFIHAKIIQEDHIGSLRVDHSIPEEEPYLFLELRKDISSFVNKKYVTLKVRVEDFISHK